MKKTLKDIKKAIIHGQDENEVEVLIQKAILEGLAANEIIEKGLIGGIETMGKLWKEGEAFLPEVLLSAKIMKSALDVVKKIDPKSNTKSKSKVVIGTVMGDIHDIGKSIVGMMMETFGFEVYDIGVDVEPKRFVQTARTHKVEIVAMSALLTTVLPHLQRTVETIRNSGIPVITMVGGAPVTQEYADRIGADGYAPDGILAVDKAKELLKRGIA